MRWFLHMLFVAWLIGIVSSACAQQSDPKAIFEQRLMPIFKSENPSSCVQCHLSSVDLKDYILPSSRDTFLSLRDQGLIDVERPKESKILRLISMGDVDPDALAQRIHSKTREAEYEAFASWIDACCQDSNLLAAKTSEEAERAGPTIPDEVIRHTRRDRVLDSFVRKIWSQRMRCFPCHTPSELDTNNPMHAKPIQRHREFVAEYGARMNIFKETPLSTMQSLITSSRKRQDDRQPLINVADPLESLLILKPTAKLPPKGDDGKIGEPSSQIPVSHMGGIKMHKDDFSYKAFAAWLQDYASSVSEDYATGEDLPNDNWYPTDHVIRIKGLPTEWPILSTVQVFVHCWDGQTRAWQDTPIAFTQAKVTPRRIVNGSLFILADPERRGSLNALGESLQPSEVQLRLYLDRDEKLSDYPTLLLNSGRPDLIVTTRAQFRTGFKNADIVELADMPQVKDEHHGSQ